MPWLLALSVLPFLGRLFASSAGTAAAGGLAGYIFGRETSPSIWPSAMQLLGIAGVLVGGVLLAKQLKGILR